MKCWHDTCTYGLHTQVSCKTDAYVDSVCQTLALKFHFLAAAHVISYLNLYNINMTLLSQVAIYRRVFHDALLNSPNVDTSIHFLFTFNHQSINQLKSPSSIHACTHYTRRVYSKQSWQT